MFRKVVSEGVKRLQSGDQWTALLDYTIIAWGYVQVPYTHTILILGSCSLPSRFNAGSRIIGNNLRSVFAISIPFRRL